MLELRSLDLPKARLDIAEPANVAWLLRNICFRNSPSKALISKLADIGRENAMSRTNGIQIKNLEPLSKDDILSDNYLTKSKIDEDMHISRKEVAMFMYNLMKVDKNAVGMCTENGIASEAAASRVANAHDENLKNKINKLLNLNLIF